MRRVYPVSPTPASCRSSRDRRAGIPHHGACSGDEYQGGAARGWDLAIRRLASPRGRYFARNEQVNSVLEIDYPNRCARVQPGVTNLAITKAVEHEGFYYAPDPSSQIACSIGGNVGENSGGVHCLKYGLTTNNILGLEIVLMGGEIVRLGGKHLDSEFYDLMGLMTGSEGLLGVITEVTVRILQKAQAARGILLGFPSVEAGADCVAKIIANGIIPGG